MYVEIELHDQTKRLTHWEGGWVGWGGRGETLSLFSPQNVSGLHYPPSPPGPQDANDLKIL
jgi:hypothetical protein